MVRAELEAQPREGRGSRSKAVVTAAEQWDRNSRKPSKAASCLTVEAAAAKQLQSSKSGKKNEADWERQQERAESQG